MVSLSFYPVGSFIDPETNETACLPIGTDKDCITDKYETCLQQSLCPGGVGSCPPQEQMKLVRFLGCFEADHHSDMSFADQCAVASNISASAVHECFDDAVQQGAAWDALQQAARQDLLSATCFPWIMVGGEVVSTDPDHGCFGNDAATTPLLPLLCAAAPAAGVAPLPAACAALAAARTE